MKYLLNMPDELHAEVKEKAWKARKSMNQYILDCIENPLDDDCKPYPKDKSSR